MSGMNDASPPQDRPHNTQLDGLHMDAAMTAQHPTAESAAQDFTEDSLKSLMARLDEFKGPQGSNRFRSLAQPLHSRATCRPRVVQG